MEGEWERGVGEGEENERSRGKKEREMEKKFAYIQKIAYYAPVPLMTLHKIFPEVHAMHLQDNTTTIPTSQDLAQPIKTFLS